jgi:short-subunit dehydrogenase
VRLAEAGARLVLVARRADRLEEVAARCRTAGSPEVHVVPADLADGAGPRAVAERATSLLGAVDLLVNNAGFAVPGLFEKSPMPRTESMLRLNCLAPVVLARELLPGMLSRGRGWVLNVSSMAGLLPAPYQAAYSGSKAFLLNFSESLREEAKPRGVVVTALCPGVTDTEFFEAAGYRGSNKFLKNKMDADRVARAGLAALVARKPRAVPGVVNKVLVFAGLRLSPRRLVQVVARRLMAARPPPVRPE